MGCPSQPLSSTLGVESTAWPAECRAVRLPLRHQEGQCPRQGLPQPSSGAWAPSCSLEGWRDGDGAMGMERCRDAATEQAVRPRLAPPGSAPPDQGIPAHPWGSAVLFSNLSLSAGCSHLK